jgi:pilus assembly protein CpaC
VIRNRLLHTTSTISAALAMAALFSASTLLAQQASQSPRELTLTQGKSLVVNTAAPIERVAVGFGDIAEARAVAPTEVLLDGKAPGETSLIIWQSGGTKLFFDVIVRANTAPAAARLETLRQRIVQELPGQDISVDVDGGVVFLRGSVRDMTSSERAVAIASTAGKVVNLLYVDVPPTDIQILLKVQFASVDRNAAKELGANIISTGGANTLARVSTGQFQPPAPTQVGGTGTSTFTLNDALNVFLFRPDINLGATIRAFETRGLAEILAEPNVLAINGKPANFLAGGEFPYPILQGGQGGVGTVTVAFRQFGVRINFLPVVTARGTIRLDVAPEVSALDYSAGLTVQGFTVPGLATRRVETEVELKSGQSFVIGGLLDRRLTETINKIPLLGDIPLLGKLFQSKAANNRRDELLVVVTPEIVRPAEQGQVPHLEFPQPLEGPNQAPQTPPVSVTGAVAPPTGQRIPVEQLVQQLKTESEMNLQQRSQVSSWPGSQPLPGWGPGPAPQTPSAPSATPTAPAAPSPAATPPATSATSPPAATPQE